MFFLRGKVSCAQTQGPRKYQEDYILNIPFENKKNGRGHLIGIMDGHSNGAGCDGGAIARLCSKIIPRLFDLEAEDINLELQTLVEKLDARTCLAEMGSTLSLAHINESHGIVTTAVLGDSPIIVVDNTSTVQQGVEHNVRSNILERELAVDRGAIYKDDGYICATHFGPGLQLSRSLGDCNLRKVLDRAPVICTYRIGVDSFVIVCSDGLSALSCENSGDATFENILRNVKSGKDAQDILHMVAIEDLHDNTSVVIWKARKWRSLLP